MEGATIVDGPPVDTGVTTFANEACEAVTALTPYDLGSYLEPAETEQDLRKYFERPRCVTTGTLPVGSLQNLVWNQPVTQTFLTTIFPQWSQRLAGVYGITFDLRFRITIAASPFHQGLLCLAFQYGSVGSSGSTRYNRSVVPYAATNLPHVRLDLSEQTSVELVVPFLFTAAYFPVGVSDTNGLDLGSVGLTTVIPIESVAALAPPTYKVFLTLENVKLFGADQAGVTNITLQGGTMLDELRQSKLISTTLNQAAKVSRFVANQVPALSGVAGTTAWALGIASGAAKYFGFSQPVSNKPVRRILPQQHVDEHHVDKPYEGSVVSLFGSNTLAFSRDFACSDVDEMALKYVFSQYSQVCLARVSTGNLHGDPVYATPVALPAFWFRSGLTPPVCNRIHAISSSSTTTNAFYPTTLYATASMFRSWRGSIKFRFTFGKSKYHAGRYLITFNPNIRYGSELNNLASRYLTVEGPEIDRGVVQPYGVSMMCDLKDGNVFEFTAPYHAENPYVGTTSAGVGSVVVTCIDALQAPTTVASSIGLLVEVAGGSDFEVADYAGNFLVSHPLGVVTTQSGDGLTASFFEADLQAGADIGSTTIAPCENTMGEHVTSLKQIIMHPVSFRDTATSATNWMVIPPWWTHSFMNVIGGLTAPLSTTADYWGASYTPAYIAGMYAFARGSTDVSVYLPTNSGGTTMYIEQRPSELFNAWYNVSNYAGRWNAGATPKLIATTGAGTPAVLHARLPTFANNVRLPTWVGNAISTLTRRLRNNNLIFFSVPGSWITHFYRFVYNNSGGVATPIVFRFSAGEDAMLSQFMGPEPVIVPALASTTTLNPEWPSIFG